MPRCGRRCIGHADEDRLIDLYFGLLPQAAAREVLAHLRACAACEGRFRVLVREREELRGSAGPRLVESAIVLPPPADDAARPIERRGVIAAGIAAAAILALLVLLPLYLAGPGPYWLPLDREFMLLRAGPLPAELARFGAGLEAYREHDAGRAAELLESAEVPESYTRLRDLFLASALALDDRQADALPVLERLRIHRLPMPWRARALWVSYTALRDAGRIEEASSLLDDLAARDDEIGALARLERRRLERRRAIYSGSPNSTKPAQ